MKKLIISLLACFLLSFTCSAVRYNPENVPKCTPMIQEAALNDNGSLSVVIFIDNRHGCSIEKFTLDGALIRFGDTRVILSGCIKNKTIQTGGKAFTVKISAKKVPYVDDYDLLSCSYELSYSYKIGKRTYKGTVDVENNQCISEVADE